MDDVMGFNLPSRIFKQPTWVTLPLGLLLLLSAGCGQSSSGTAGFNPQAGPPQVPREITATIALLDPSGLVGMPRANLFFSLLEEAPVTRPDPTETPEGGTEQATAAPPPPPEPFTDFKLGGIIYLGKRSLALMAVPGGTSGTSKVVHAGDVFKTTTTPAYQVQVSKIDKTTLTLSVLAPPAELPPEMQTKILKIPSMVGYGSSPSGGSTSSSSASSEGSQAVSGGSASTGTPQVPKEIQDLLGAQALNTIDSSMSPAFATSGTPAPAPKP